MRMSFCRDKTLAEETILYVRLFGREFYAWFEARPRSATASSCHGNCQGLVAAYPTWFILAQHLHPAAVGDWKSRNPEEAQPFALADGGDCLLAAGAYV
jgi:hypothetical protein